MNNPYSSRDSTRNGESLAIVLQIRDEQSALVRIHASRHNSYEKGRGEEEKTTGVPRPGTHRYRGQSLPARSRVSLSLPGSLCMNGEREREREAGGSLTLRLPCLPLRIPYTLLLLRGNHMRSRVREGGRDLSGSAGSPRSLQMGGGDGRRAKVRVE